MIVEITIYSCLNLMSEFNNDNNNSHESKEEVSNLVSTGYHFPKLKSLLFQSSYITESLFQKFSII
jgi:hypothetical protein